MVPVPGPAWPEDATVEVWLAPLDPPAAVLERLASVLSGAERQRAAAFRSAADTRRFSAARGWLRHVLGAVLGLEPAAVPVSQGAGKPRLLLGGPPQFNVSHAGELVAVAVASFDVGVDVEHLRSGRRWADLIGVVCSPDEATTLGGMPPEEREDAFLGLWTAKEAYLKGTGEGLNVAPERAAVGRPSPALHARVRVDGRDSGWRVRPIQPADGYVGAVAAEGCRWRVRLRPTAVVEATLGAGARSS